MNEKTNDDVGSPGQPNPVPAQDRAETQDPTVDYVTDQWGRKRSRKDGSPLPDEKQGAPVGYGSGAAADLTAPSGVVGQAEEDDAKDTDAKDTEPKAARRQQTAGREETRSEEPPRRLRRDGRPEQT